MAMVLLVVIAITPAVIGALLLRTRWWWLPAGLTYLAACGIWVLGEDAGDFDKFGFAILAMVVAVYATILWGMTALMRYLSLRRPAGTRSSAPAGRRTRARRRSSGT